MERFIEDTSAVVLVRRIELLPRGPTVLGFLLRRLAHVFCFFRGLLRRLLLGRVGRLWFRGLFSLLLLLSCHLSECLRPLRRDGFFLSFGRRRCWLLGGGLRRRCLHRLLLDYYFLLGDLLVRVLLNGLGLLAGRGRLFLLLFGWRRDLFRHLFD